MTRRRSVPALRVLRKSELDRLEKWRGLGGFMIVYYFGRSANPTGAVLENLFAAWMADKRDKVRDVDLACALGTMYGDLLAEKYQFDWRMRRDQQGEAFALVNEASGWENYPIDYVWKRVQPGALGEETGFFRAGLAMWRGKVPARKATRVATRRPARKK